MKRTTFFITYFVLGFSLISIGQIKIDKYCIIATNSQLVGTVNSKIAVKLYWGEEDSLFSFKNSSLLLTLKKVEEKTNLLDVLNYMATLGWQYIGPPTHLVVNSFGKANTNTELWFKQTFDKSELK